MKATEKRQKTKCERCFYGDELRNKETGERYIWCNAWGCRFCMDEANDPCKEYSP